MTPAERTEWERLVTAYQYAAREVERLDDFDRGWGSASAKQRAADERLASARAALDAFVERLTAGEEVVRVVNPEYPGDKHYWAANNVPTFPVSYVITPGTFRVTRVEEGE